ncbi:hypothetical protein [Haloglomus litoreum]|uniref:hypothetical protein n=1 Tax=Haloglomus litoreum TaxID=3034026 RepID=UPI0023E83B2B|nr:hypothetical protein [Haloglomus sp. DT116]
MSKTEDRIPQSCGNCAHREQVSGACGHELRQLVIADNTDREVHRCPVYAEGVRDTGDR